MASRWWIVLALVCASLFSSAEARAEGFFGPDPQQTPSVFTYAWRGFWLGTLDGGSIGYLVARRDGWEGDDWKPLVYGLGIGALSGSALGFGLGFADLAADRPGRYNLALRDMVYGAGFGAAAGAVSGGLAVIKSGDAEHILFGAAIGTVVGTGVGLVIGLIEGRRITESPQHRWRGANEHFQLSLGQSRDVSGRAVWQPTLSGRF
jgi:hypothetical protein